MASVWRSRNFRLLFGGQVGSQIGSQITLLAFPTLAITAFGADPPTVGLLVAAERVPFPVLALLAGALIDRRRKRRVMIGCDVARALVLGSIPVIAMVGQLQLWHLFAAAILTGVATVFFDIAYLAHVPELVEPDQRHMANRGLEATFSGSALAGPGLGGLLIQAVNAARAVAVDALSFLLSAITLALIRAPQPRQQPSDTGLRSEISAGVRFVFQHPTLRWQLLMLTAAGFSMHMIEGPLYVFAYRDLRLSPGELGLALATAGIGSLVGISVARRATNRLGAGRSIAWGMGGAAAIQALIPLALIMPALPVLIVIFIGNGIGDALGNISQFTLRQSLTPAHLQGRMTAVFRTAFWGAWPLGNVAGGLLAAIIGSGATIVVAAGVAAVISALIFVTPLGRVRDFGT